MLTWEFEELTNGVRELSYKEWWNMHDHYMKSPLTKEVYCQAWKRMFDQYQVAPGIAGFNKPGMEDLFECCAYRVLAGEAKKRFVKAAKEAESMNVLLEEAAS